MKNQHKRALKVLGVLVVITLIAGLIIVPQYIYYTNIPHDICPDTNVTDILFFCAPNINDPCILTKFFYIYHINENGVPRSDIHTRDVCFGFPRCEEYKPTWVQLIGIVPRTEKEIKHQYDHILAKRYGVTEAPSVYLCDNNTLIVGKDKIKMWFKEH